MTDDNPQKAPRDGGARLFGKRSAAAGLAAALLLTLVLAVVYGMGGGGGKKPDTLACAASRSIAERIAPLARGQVAALSVAKSPKPATDISFDGPDGRKLTLADFRGKTILVNLWATWCAPCRAEMPSLDRLQAQAGGTDFEVVAVNIDTARLERRKPFLDSVGVEKLAFYTDPKAGVFQTLKQAGKVIGLPTTILIDAAGCELGVMAGPAEWDSPEALELIRAAVQPVRTTAAPGR